MSRFLEPFILPTTGVTKQLLRDWGEGMRPTVDLVDLDTLNVANDKIFVEFNVARWKRFTFSFTDFAKAAVKSDDITIVSLSGGGFVEEVRVVVSEIWLKAGSVAFIIADLDVGITGSNPNEFIDNADLKTIDTSDATAHYITDATDRMLTENGATDVLMKLDTTPDLTQDAVQGVVDVLLKYGISPSSLAP